jgi:hypothetical protein
VTRARRRLLDALVVERYATPRLPPVPVDTPALIAERRRVLAEDWPPRRRHRPIRHLRRVA